jgi:hypothetical protein
METKVDKHIYADKLGKELEDVGIQNNGISPLAGGKLIVHLVDEKQAGQAQAIIDVHDGSDDPDLLLWV